MHVRIIAALLFFVAIVRPAFAADPPPAISARDAIAIAEKSLANRGLNQSLWVAAVTLERSTILKPKWYWFVKWSESIPASDPKNREVGVKVTMDGTATRLVKEPGA